MQRSNRRRNSRITDQTTGREEIAERRQALLLEAVLAPEPFSLENFFRALGQSEGDAHHDEPLTA